MSIARSSALAIAVAILAGCLAGQPGGEGSPVELAVDGTCSTGSSVHGADTAVGSSPVGDDARFPWEHAHPRVAEGFDPTDELFTLGGRPTDGIPALDEPCFAPVSADIEQLEPQSPVVVVVHGGQARAYPLAILHFHEIVNDVIGGDPVAVTYCPLCNSGIAFERTVEGRVLDFAVSGRLHRSNLVMYDRQTRNLWLQFTGVAIAGEPFVGAELARLSTWLLSWSEFRAAHPDGWVLTRETGHERDYDRNPYAGYAAAPPPDDHDPYDGVWPEVGTGLHAKSRVVGIASSTRDAAVAIPRTALTEARMTTVEVDGDHVLVLWTPGKADALDATDLDDGFDVGQVGTYLPRAIVDDEQRTLTFRPDEDDIRSFVDEETGSTWDVLGHAVAGPLRGARLEPVERAETFWSVWFSFHPSTEVHTPGS